MGRPPDDEIECPAGVSLRDAGIDEICIVPPAMMSLPVPSLRSRQGDARPAPYGS